MQEFWNDRYGQTAFAYGEQPNQFLKEQLELLPPGTVLFPAEGEGRNAVYAAQLGWTVSAFDQSSEGKKKALSLAEKRHVQMDYRVGDIQNIRYNEGQFDVIALIYAHFPAEIKSACHRQLIPYLKSGGLIIFEAFSKNNLNYLAKNQRIGGPKDAATLFSMEEMRADFAGFDVDRLEEKEVELNEGLYHNGTGSVIRFVGRKK